jgi:hypothetical protein
VLRRRHGKETADMVSRQYNERAAQLRRVLEELFENKREEKASRFPLTELLLMLLIICCTLSRCALLSLWLVPPRRISTPRLWRWM